MADWIQSAASLQQWLQERPAPAWVGLDTEFVRERTYFPKLALVQLAVDATQLAIYDPLVGDDGRAQMQALIARPVIMHSAGEDLQSLKHRYELLPTQLFDTQIAAALCGVGSGLGYQRLVSTLLDVELEKTQTRSDWTRRPLSADQLHYAAEDVRHLPALHALLHERLERQQRLHWLEQDCARLLALAASEAVDANPQASLRGVEKLDEPAQRRLRRLLRWRDRRALEADRPKGWILDNSLAWLLAVQPPASRSQLEDLLDERPKAPRRGRAELFELLRAEDEPGFELVRPPDPRLRESARVLNERVGARAAELGLDEGVLCPRRHVEARVRGDDWPDAVTPWRRQLLDPLL